MESLAKCHFAAWLVGNGDYPENLHMVFCPNKQRCFEPFTCLDLTRKTHQPLPVRYQQHSVRKGQVYFAVWRSGRADFLDFFHFRQHFSQQRKTSEATCRKGEKYWPPERKWRSKLPGATRNKFLSPSPRTSNYYGVVCHTSLCVVVYARTCRSASSRPLLQGCTFWSELFMHFSIT